MLDRFLRPRWDSPKSHTRIQALQRMPVGDPLIAQLASTDSEPVVRREAVARLLDLNLLCSIARKDLDQQVRETAWDRFVQMMEVPITSEAEAHQRLLLLQEISLATVLTRLIRSQADLKIKQAAVAALQDEMHLEEIALHSSIASLRQAAAEKIQSESILKELLLESRNRDKNVYRVTRDRLEQIEQQRRDQKALEQQTQLLKEQIQQQLNAAFHPLYQVRLDYLEQRWRETAVEDSEVTAALAEMRQRCQRYWQREQAAESWRQRSLILNQHLAEAPNQERLLAWMLELQEHLEALQNPPSLTAEQEAVRLQQRQRLLGIQEWWQAWQQLEAHCAVGAPSDLLTQKNDLLRQAPFNSTQLQLQEIYPAPASDPVVSDTMPAGTEPILADAVEALLPLATATATATEPVAVAGPPLWTSQHTERLQRIERMIDEGHSELAIRLWSRFPKQVHPPADLRERLHQVDSRLKEWKDWQSYAVLPKKQQLLREMQQLLQADLLPAELWKSEKQLRRQWRELGVADHHTEFPLWQEFSAAGAQIRQRCQAWRDEQKRQADAAEQAAQQLLLQLQALSIRDTGRDAWKTLKDQVTEAQNSWKALRSWFRPDNSVAGGVRAELERLQLSIQGEELANRRKMEQLVQQAESLSQETLTPAQMRARIKQLQQLWKEVGIHRHRDNQTLWPRFKAAADLLFSQLQTRQQEVESQLSQLSVTDPDIQQKFAALKEEARFFSALQPSLQELERSLRQQNQTQQQENRLQHIDSLLSCVQRHSHHDCSTEQLLAAFPAPWQQKSLPAQVPSTTEALLLLEAVLNLATPPEQQAQRDQLLLERWTRGQNMQQIRQELLPALLQQILLHPLEDAGFYARLECVWP